MNTLHKSSKNRLPEWQSAKMKNLIEERWSEVWEVVIARKRNSQHLSEHTLSSDN